MHGCTAARTAAARPLPARRSRRTPPRSVLLRVALCDGCALQMSGLGPMAGQVLPPPAAAPPRRTCAARQRRAAPPQRDASPRVATLSDASQRSTTRCTAARRVAPLRGVLHRCAACCNAARRVATQRDASQRASAGARALQVSHFVNYAPHVAADADHSYARERYMSAAAVPAGPRRAVARGSLRAPTRGALRGLAGALFVAHGSAIYSPYGARRGGLVCADRAAALP